MNTFKLRPSLLIGAGGASLQQDGGERKSNWSDWYEKGYIKDGANPKDAASHYDRWRDDVMLMRRLNLQTCLLGVDWARIEPEEGVFDAGATEHVKEEILLLRGVGISPLLILHYFSDPLWFSEKGGWEREENIRHFLLFVRHMITSLGHLAKEYITIFEPVSYATGGYLGGSLPPGKSSPKLANTVLSVMLAAHVKAYKIIHDTRRSMGFFDDTRVSVALNPPVPEQRGRSNSSLVSSILPGGKGMQTAAAEAVALGRFSSPIKNYSRARPGRYCDFHAITYHGRAAAPDPAGRFPKNDLGATLAPGDMAASAGYIDGFCRLPIYLIDCGCCDNNDSFRARYLCDHLLPVNEAALPIERYYYWSFLDGFELCEGESARFGLVRTDFQTGERRLKEGGKFFSELIKSRGVTQELYSEYAEAQDYPR